jgi:hypothetical protein
MNQVKNMDLVVHCCSCGVLWCSQYRC